MRIMFYYDIVSYFLFFFFFSSRRRHTRYIGDWSSDVCSSDLRPGPWGLHLPSLPLPHGPGLAVRRGCREDDEIGRASCRERGEIVVGAGVVEKKKRERESGVKYEAPWRIVHGR